MAASSYLRIRNHDRYQHYKDRRPVWVKLYQDLLEDVAFTCLPDASKAHAVLLTLIASRYDNRIPNDAQWIARAIHASDPVDLDALVSAGWLEVCEPEAVASKPLAKAERPAMPKRTENRGQRTERSTTAAKNAADAVTDDPPGFDVAFSAMPTRHGGNPRPRAAKAYRARLREGATPEALADAARRYAAHCKATGRVGTPYVMQAATFFGPDGHWQQPWDDTAPPSTPDRADALEARAAAILAEQRATAEKGRQLIAARAGLNGQHGPHAYAGSEP